MADTITIPDCGKIALLKFMLGITAPEALTLKLFTNNATPAAASVAGDFTAITTHGLGTPWKELAMASWPTPTISSAQATSTFAAQTHTATATDDGTETLAYGYFVIMKTTGTLLWVCKFASAKPITYQNETITVTPQLKFGQV